MKRQQHEIVRLASGKTAIKWIRIEKPEVNHWYQLIKEMDYIKIVKDFYSPELNQTFYKILEYYNSDILYSGKSLATCREIVRDLTYRSVM